MNALVASVLVLIMSLAAEPVSIDPLPRPVLATETVVQWSFDEDAEGWTAARACTVSSASGALRVVATGDDPYIHGPAIDLPGGPLVVTLRARGRPAGGGEFYWITDRSPGWGEGKAVAFSLPASDQWRELSVRFAAEGRLRGLRLDPGQSAGELEIDSIRLERETLFPLAIDCVTSVPGAVRFTVTNHADAPVAFTAAGGRHTLEAGASTTLDRPIEGTALLEPIRLELQLAERPTPTLARTVFLLRPEVKTAWIALPMDGGSLDVSPDGTVARITRGGVDVAYLGPLVVGPEGRVPAMKMVEKGARLVFEGDGVRVTLAARGQEIDVAIASREPCQGPTVRVPGDLAQGIFAGQEYLGAGESSSSKLDIETAEHLRYAPDPLQVTMPLMAVVTDRASVALAWDDMKTQPIFAAPNFVDRTPDHLMALRGTNVRATIRVDRKGPIEEMVLWAVKRRGLPPLPEPPRDEAAQKALVLAAINGPIKNQDGWGHCGEANWPRQPYADVASTLWRLTGEPPELPRIVPGGAHVGNDAIYFVTGRADQWLAAKRAHVEGLLAQQKPDGAFEYHGPYRRGHHEDTASGVCARPAFDLLQIAQWTGDERALAAGLRTLDYMKRFDTPRGAQTWELSMHTPDQLASAYLVWAYVLGHELTGREDYLAEARRWALSGVPFVYLWSDRPVMRYATVPVLGATNWRAPNWIGLPVQWVGGVYAYALTKLAPYDQTLDWNHLARGILISAQQQQYPDGPHAGLLPDSFALAGQTRRPPDINPCALVSLEWVLRGRLDSLAAATGDGHRVVAPFPVEIRGNSAHIRAEASVKYQIVVDGQRVVDVVSQGEDVVPLGQ
ncbi:MAG: hypothetical protein JW809_06745 [Pirellulales bacterium]|nr:hypothetical protein [Pirellulales bacterium]